MADCLLDFLIKKVFFSSLKNDSVGEQRERAQICAGQYSVGENHERHRVDGSSVHRTGRGRCHQNSGRCHQNSGWFAQWCVVTISGHVKIAEFAIYFFVVSELSATGVSLEPAQKQTWFLANGKPRAESQIQFLNRFLFVFLRKIFFGFRKKSFSFIFYLQIPTGIVVQSVCCPTRTRQTSTYTHRCCCTISPVVSSAHCCDFSNETSPVLSSAPQSSVVHPSPQWCTPVLSGGPHSSVVDAAVIFRTKNSRKTSKFCGLLSLSVCDEGTLCIFSWKSWIFLGEFRFCLKSFHVRKAAWIYWTRKRGRKKKSFFRSDGSWRKFLPHGASGTFSEFRCSEAESATKKCFTWTRPAGKTVSSPCSSASRISPRSCPPRDWALWRRSFRRAPRRRSETANFCRAPRGAAQTPTWTDAWALFRRQFRGSPPGRADFAGRTRDPFAWSRDNPVARFSRTSECPRGLFPGPAGSGRPSLASPLDEPNSPGWKEQTINKRCEEKIIG